MTAHVIPPPVNSVTNMKKERNQFVTLSKQDRQFILNLCSRLPFEAVVDLLKKPRSEGGLGIVASRSALLSLLHHLVCGDRSHRPLPLGRRHSRLSRRTGP
jgi:hypothetical protein